MLEPWLYGSSTGLSPLAIIVAAVFWTTLWGPVGLLLATPLTVCLVVLGRHVPQLHFFEVLLGDQPVLAPEVKFYQRLLAGDPHDAEELAEDMLEERPLAEVYDGMVLPALVLADQDRARGAIDHAGARAIAGRGARRSSTSSRKMAAAEPAAESRARPARAVRRRARRPRSGRGRHGGASAAPSRGATARGQRRSDRPARAGQDRRLRR